MSSHHIVRDEQEPALLILHDQYSPELLGELLEWSPTVILDSTLVELIENCNYKIDVVIGTQSELDLAKDYLHHQEPIKYLSKNENEQTLLQALFFLSAANYKGVNILAPVSGFKFESLEPILSKLSVVVYNQGYKWYFVKGKSFHKWMKKDQILRVLGPAFVTESQNLKLNNKEFVVVDDGQIQLEMSADNFWLGEAI